MRLPSGAQTGSNSRAGSVVNRCRNSRAVSNSHTSAVPVDHPSDRDHAAVGGQPFGRLARLGRDPRGPQSGVRPDPSIAVGARHRLRGRRSVRPARPTARRSPRSLAESRPVAQPARDRRRSAACRDRSAAPPPPLPRKEHVVRRREYRRRFRIEQTRRLHRVQRTDVDALTVGRTEREEQKVLAIRQELRVPVAQVWCYDLGGGYGLPATGWHAKQRFGRGASEQDGTRGVPGTTTSIQRCLRQVLHEAGGHVDTPQLPAGEERHRLVVGRPEGVRFRLPSPRAAARFPSPAAGARVDSFRRRPPETRACVRLVKSQNRSHQRQAV